MGFTAAAAERVQLRAQSIRRLPTPERMGVMRNALSARWLWIPIFKPTNGLAQTRCSSSAP
jgi:hypothetical protein